MPTIIGVRFKAVGKIYYFSPKDIIFQLKDGAIVETARGIEYGTVVIVNREVAEEKIVSPLKEVIRKASEKDIKQYQKNLERVPDALVQAAEKIAKRNLDMKLIDCEYTFDGSKIIFYFTSEGRVDFRDLVRDLAGVFRVRIELRQIGIRDEAKALGGIAPCGRACCCNQHLGDFERVSIKMAKTQGLSLNPVKISGLCGRLMCCLSYENEYYSEVYRLMPKLGSDITTPDGMGVVINNNMLKKLVKVKVEMPDKSYVIKEYALDQVKTSHMQTNEKDDDSSDEDIKDLSDDSF